MRNVSLTLCVVLCNLFNNAFAQTTTIGQFRMGTGEAKYHSAEIFQTRNGWIFPDVGYLDFGDAKNYREYFAGFGYTPVESEHFTLAVELFYVQSDGPESNRAKYIWPWIGFNFSLGSKITGDVSGFIYLTIDERGPNQFVLEHAKLEYKLCSWLKAGAGYGTYRSGNDGWQDRPFVTATLTPAGGKYGSFEFWYEKLPGGETQFQLRLELIHLFTKKK